MSVAFTVRPTHPWLPYLLPGLGRWWSLIGLGRVVTKGDYYVGDGPSIGPVTWRTMAYAQWHDRAYRKCDERSESVRLLLDRDARREAHSTKTHFGSYRWQWALFGPMLRLAWRYRWGSWQDMPAWLWWICAVVLFPICWAVVLLTLWPVYRYLWLTRPWRK